MEDMIPELKERMFDVMYDPRSFLALCLVSKSWARVGVLPAVQARAKSRFARSQRVSFREAGEFTDVLTSRLPNRALHGLERMAIVPCRVGGPGAEVFYAERTWVDGRLDGDEILWEISAALLRIADAGIVTYRRSPYDGIDAVLDWESRPNHAQEMEAAAQQFNAAGATTKAAEAEPPTELDEGQRKAREVVGKWYRCGVVCQWRRWEAGRAVWCEPGSSEEVDEDGVPYSVPEWDAWPELEP